MKSLRFSIGPEEAGQKLSHVLRSRLHELSIRAIKKDLERGLCSLNGRVETFASRVVKKGEKVFFEPSGQAGPRVVFEKNRVLFEDGVVLAYDKPAGVICNPHGPKIKPNLFAMLHEHKGPLWMVHRLDRDTSGVMLFAKSKEVRDLLLEAFKAHKVKKTYLAVADGIVTPWQGTWTSQVAILEKGKGYERWGSVSQGGKEAITAFRVLETGKQETLVELRPKTGRTHQIRVHLAEAGHPVLGDTFYGKRFRSARRPGRHLLHARELSLVHPGQGTSLRMQAQLPEGFRV